MDILTSSEGRYIQAAEAMLFSFLSNNPGSHTIYLLSQEAPSKFRDLARLSDLADVRFNLLNPNLHVRGIGDASSAMGTRPAEAQREAGQAKGRPPG